MEKELLYWSRWNYAVASFCQDVAVDESSSGSLIELFSGEGAEWMGYPAIGFVLNQAAMTRATSDQLQRKIEDLQAEYKRAIEINQAHRHQSQALATEFRDREWKLQETIADLQEQIRRQQEALDQQEKNSAPPSGFAIHCDSQQLSDANVVTPPSSSVLTQSQVSSHKDTPSKQRGVSLMKFSESVLLQDLSNNVDLLDGKENRKNNAVAANSLNRVLVPRFK